jgi:cytochrome c oxidase subunit 4
MMDLGLIVGMGIAVTKAGLLIAFYMHLREERTRTKVISGAVFFWMILLFGITLSDYYTRLGV